MSDDPRARLEALQAVCEALSHPARRQILLTVHFRGGAMTAGQIAGRFEHAWPTTTRHLKVLEAAGLLRHERRGRERVYTLARERLGLLMEWLGWFERPGETPVAPEAKPKSGRRRNGRRGAL